MKCLRLPYHGKFMALDYAITLLQHDWISFQLFNKFQCTKFYVSHVELRAECTKSIAFKIKVLHIPHFVIAVHRSSLFCFVLLLLLLFFFYILVILCQFCNKLNQETLKLSCKYSFILTKQPIIYDKLSDLIKFSTWKSVDILCTTQE